MRYSSPTFSLTGSSNTLTVNTGANIGGGIPLTLTSVSLNATDNANTALLNVNGTLSGAAMTFGRISGNGSIAASGRLQLWQGVSQTWQGSITGAGVRPGAWIPNQRVSSLPGKPDSATVG